MVPTHFYQQFASTTRLWNGTDSEENFNANCAVEENYKKLNHLGWLEPNVITYKYNNQGFRDDEFDQQVAGIALGCSHTQGIGVPVEHAWPSHLQHMLGQKVWNLGIGGAALDTCYRMLEYWIEHLNVKFVVCAVPSISRYEVFNSNWSNILPSMPLEIKNLDWLVGYQKNYLLYDQNSEMNQRKNLQAMQHICNKYHIPFYYDLLKKFGGHALARDLQHCGTDAHAILANKFFNIIQGNNK
jgi:hypothetical protein